MAGRVRLVDDVGGFNGVAAPKTGLAVGVEADITVNVVNEAAEAALSGVVEADAELIRRMWASDPTSEPARAYFLDQVRQRANSNYGNVAKRKFVVRERLNARETSELISYASEYDLIFKGELVHDHGLYSARRAIDGDLLDRSYPPEMPRVDFGGSVLHHVRAGHENTVVVSPFDKDSKDPVRARLTTMALRTISASSESGDLSKAMADSVLSDEGRFHVNESVQTYSRPVKRSTALHVYDVPIEDWPEMMDRTGAIVHDGIVHFTNELFESGNFTMETTGSHFEVDTKRDVFRMRVGNSVAQWYAHKWTQFLRYGADQIMTTDKCVYSYKIIERRRDTIRYRVLRVGSAARPDTGQCYALPGVERVEVAGFQVAGSGSDSLFATRLGLRSKKYYFPRPIWDSLLRYASTQVDRNGLSYEKLANQYRVFVPRQSANSVKYSGGYHVPVEDIPGLLVMVGVVAHYETALMQRSLRAKTDEIQENRRLSNAGLMLSALEAFLSTAKAAGAVILSPYNLIVSAAKKLHEWRLNEHLVTWRPEVKIRSLNMAVIRGSKSLPFDAVPARLVGLVAPGSATVARAYDMARSDPKMAKAALDALGDSLNSKAKSRLSDIASVLTDADNSDTPKGSTATAATGVSWETDGLKKIKQVVLPVKPSTVVILNRRAAIQEAILECQTEIKNITAACERIYREVCPAGVPNNKALKSNRDQNYNPDLWVVKNGVITESVLDPRSKFVHGAVYCPVEYSHAKVQVPEETSYSGKDSVSGKFVQRDYVKLQHDFTGYVLVIDQLMIYNGSAIQTSLVRALELGDESFGFQVVAHKGPPGCGKTTAIVNDVNLDDEVIMTPTRLSSAQVKLKLTKSSESLIKARVRTLHSFLVNFFRLKGKATDGVNAARFDEYVLSRAGQLYAIAALLGVLEIHGYGDLLQIHHVTRVEVPDRHVLLEHQVMREEYLTFRNPPAIVAGYNGFYGDTIRSAITDYDGLMEHVSFPSEIVWGADVRILSMYQADKAYMRDLAKLYCPSAVVSTVHEAQGTDCDHVVLINNETNRRPTDDNAKYWLYAKQSYCLVAVSRARRKFTYVKQGTANDLIIDMIKRSKDPIALQLAKDIASQGTSSLST